MFPNIATGAAGYHIDSFANELFAGNPAGICLVPAFPANDVMQKIAAENRHSETAFVVARADGDFDLRWFTPVVEDDLCGHATLASAYALSLRGHDTWPVRFHTVSGLLTVNRDHERFELDFPSRPAVSCEIPTGLLSALGLEMAEVMRDPRPIRGDRRRCCDRINPVRTRPILGQTHWQADISSAATQFSRCPNVVHASRRPRKDRW